MSITITIKGLVNEVESSKEFKGYKEDNKEAYLAHFFCMKDKDVEKGNWQAGYYSKEQDKITVFETNPVKKLPEEEVFKKEDLVKPLIISNVKIEPEEAFEKIDELLKKDYSAEIVTKKIVLLQTLEKELYNITLITQSLSLINIKIDANTGEFISHEKKSIMSLKADE